MGSFGSISLANKFGIILGSLIFVAFGAGLVKLWVIKRRLRRHIKIDEELAKNPRTEKTHEGRENDPRYLFGVRAIEKGHFGGVAQTSRPNSVAPSASASTSNPSLNNVADSNRNHLDTISSLPLENFQVKRKPSPLRLRPSEIQLAAPLAPLTESPTSPESKYVVSPLSPTIPAIWSLPVIQEPQEGQSGLPIPTATAASPRPTSFLPRLDFSDSQKPIETSFFISTPAGSVRGKRSKRESTVTGDVSYPASVRQSQRMSTIFGSFPSSAPSVPRRSVLRSHRSTISIPDTELPTIKQNESVFNTPLPPIPSSFDSSKYDFPIPPSPSTFDYPPRKESYTRTSPVKQSHVREDSEDDRRPSVTDSGYGSSPTQKSYAKRKSSDAVSLALLTGNSAISSFPRFDEPSTTHVTAAVEELPKPTPTPKPAPAPVEPISRGRKSSDTYKYQTSTSTSTSLARTHDSLRHAKSRSRSTSNRRSKQRDQIHYDPTSHHRNRSGSIQGRAVDFSQPRDSPFSDLTTGAGTMYKHSPSNSSSSENSIISYYTTSTPKPEHKTTESFDLKALSTGGSKLRYTRDIFGTGLLLDKSSSTNPIAIAARGEEQGEKTTVISLRDSAPRESVPLAQVPVAKVTRMKPIRISSHGPEFLMPGMSSLETHSTSTSPVTEERFPKRMGWGGIAF